MCNQDKLFYKVFHENKKLRYNLLSVSQLADAELEVLFLKSNSQVLNSSSKCVCDISHIGNFFQADFSLA
jgi:hypothetical protein